MSQENVKKFIEQLKAQEGCKLKPYRCTAGALTIGIGRNLDANGISMDEAESMLLNDMSKYIAQVNDALPWAKDLSPARYYVLVNMAFNMGINGLLKFKNTLRLIKTGEYEKASVEMLDSDWYRSKTSGVGIRAEELSEQMKTGEWVVYWDKRGLKDQFEASE
jgi:lysozyme